MTDIHDRHGYPLHGFFVAHRRFLGLNGKPWGDILDGPEHRAGAVIVAIIEAWKVDQHAPDTDNLRVWHIVPGQPVEDCTAWAVRTVTETATASELR